MAKDGKYLRPSEVHDEGVDSVRLSFEAGTLVVRGLDVDVGRELGLSWDDRIGQQRGAASAYRGLVGALMRMGYAVVDGAREFDEVVLRLGRDLSPHEHQVDAHAAWVAGGKRGVVVLPTGSGKSYLAEMAIETVARDTLVVAPTLDLVDQWIRRLGEAFSVPVGALGGGRHDVERLTVSTYDSAAIHMERLGGRFGLVIFDEVHHLPGELYRQAAEQAIAPFRLGLTATLERDDGKHGHLLDLVGPTVFRLGIKSLAGDILAD